MPTPPVPIPTVSIDELQNWRGGSVNVSIPIYEAIRLNELLRDVLALRYDTESFQQAFDEAQSTMDAYVSARLGPYIGSFNISNVQERIRTDAIRYAEEFIILLNEEPRVQQVGPMGEVNLPGLGRTGATPVRPSHQELMEQRSRDRTRIMAQHSYQSQEVIDQAIERAAVYAGIKLEQKIPTMIRFGKHEFDENKLGELLFLLSKMVEQDPLFADRIMGHATKESSAEDDVEEVGGSHA